MVVFQTVGASKFLSASLTGISFSTMGGFMAIAIIPSRETFVATGAIKKSYRSVSG
jgi:hypothetical protein